MRIDVIFDTVCPWCFIGKRRFERALALRPEVRAEVRWRPFLLNPEMPPGGLDRQVYLERKFGSNYRIQRIHGTAQQAGDSENITFNFDLIRRTPSSINSHRLIHLAASSTRQASIVEAIFQAYFVKGLDIGEIPVLRAIAEDCGLPGDEVEDYLQGDAGIGAIELENARFHRLGVSGVPCYILDDRYAVAGAQEPDMLARLLDIAQGTELETASR
ncbi:MAG: DsbA family oxidoreductase [Telmatospirillum sp.]|nr:DsbA family oxidoreductase [Telmatospirillum sp.]